MFTCITKHGFFLTFDNGIVMSTQFGPGSYSNGECVNGDWQAELCEVAFFDSRNNWMSKTIYSFAGLGELNDDVIPRVNMSTWLQLIDAAKRYTFVERESDA